MRNVVDLPLYQFEHLTHGHYLRGVLINEFSGLEKTIERYLSKYFFGNTDSEKAMELSNIIFYRLTFEGKRQSFKAVVDKQSVKNGFVKVSKNKWPESALFAELKLLIDERNCFAHYIMVMPSGVTDKVIGLAEFKDDIKIKWYTEAEWQKIFDDVARIAKKIEEMTDALKL